MTSPHTPETELRLDSQQAARGGIFPVRVSAAAPCPRCAAGVHPGSRSTKCPRCKGQLSLPIETASGDCTICHGAGWTVGDECDECHGSALVTATRAIRVRIPAGVTDGQRVRLPRQGFVSGRSGAPAADLYLTVNVARVELSTTGSDLTQSPDTKMAKMEKVAKLMRKAEAVAGTPEEAVLLDRAFALMAKYGLEEAMVRAAIDDGANSGGEEVGEPRVVERTFIVTSKYGSHQILTCLANALHCRGVHWKSEKTGVPMDTVRVSLFGLPDHIERVHFLWDLLEPQALRGLELLPEDASWYSTQSVYRRSWVVGFAIGIASRLREHEESAVEETGSGTALVLYDLYKRDEERAEAVIRERWPDLEAEKPCESFDPVGLAEGRRAAWSAALNRSFDGTSGSLICA